jgi:hypothetical protein
MIMTLGQAILKKMLMRPEIKQRIFEALRREAAKTETKIDDSGVDTFEVIWDTVLPIIIGKL